MKSDSAINDESVLLGTFRDNMGRTRRNCPVFGCGSTNLARLANHLDQVHGMDTEERKKWLKWSKLGIRVPRQNEEPKEFNLEGSIANALKATRRNRKKI